MTTTFYSEESANRRNSLFLALVVIAFLAAFGFVIGFSIGYGSGDEVAFGIGALVIAVGIGTISALFSYYSGDKLVLSSSHAKEISPQQAPALYDVVNEMAIAAGVPMPKVYIIEDPSPNAFATGRDPQHSSVAVTTGLLQKMNREELQGVLGHEMSHVRNYDIRFTLIVGVMVGSMALLAGLFLRYTFFFGGGRRGNNREGGGGLAIVMLLLGVVMSVVSYFFGALVQMAVSRQREYLADASSVELTRNPHGLESALAKLASDNEPLHSANGATQHLYIVNPLKKLGGGSNLFSTHPPIVDRINRLRALTGDPPMNTSEVRQLSGLE
ncbi:MAG TPA: M48 family metallopeptidase [Candidatus Limnocylindrales bacterium]